MWPVGFEPTTSGPEGLRDEFGTARQVFNHLNSLTPCIFRSVRNRTLSRNIDLTKAENDMLVFC